MVNNPQVALELAALKVADDIAAVQQRRARREARAARHGARLRAARREPQVVIFQPPRYAGLALLSAACIVTMIALAFIWKMISAVVGG